LQLEIKIYKKNSSMLLQTKKIVLICTSV